MKYSIKVKNKNTGMNCLVYKARNLICLDYIIYYNRHKINLCEFIDNYLKGGK